MIQAALAFISCIGAMCLLGGCHGGPKGSGSPMPPETMNSPAPAPGQSTVAAADEAATANSAAMVVATMPSIADARIRQEILLHAALYRAAYETNVGDFTRHFVLEPVVEAEPPNLGVDPNEFRLRVLAELVDLHVPIAWLPATWKTGGMDFFPGTQDRATRLRIKITKRVEPQATILGEVGDWTAEVGSSRQGVTATWDGIRWNIQRDRVRLVW